MEEKQYIEKLEELSFKFRDNDNLCNKSCSKCELNKKIKIWDEVGQSYCDILAAIHNESVESEEIEDTSILQKR